MNKENFLKKLRNIEISNDNFIKNYNEIGSLLVECLGDTWVDKSGRNAYYISMEFLLGNNFYNNLLEAGVYDDVKKYFEEKNVDFYNFYNIDDPALGNGGLGRLAACYLDSGANVEIPLQGFGLRYKLGLFKQSFEDGFQTEYPDDWQKFGDPFGVRKEDEKIDISFSDLVVSAIPYDYPIIGKNGKYVNTLRLWQAEGSEYAQKISEYLYPNDNDEYGKILRLRQEYFLSAASIQQLIKTFFKSGQTDLINFSQNNTIQLNDTHPVLSILEFIRILTKLYNWNFADAVNLAKKTFNYTNHTVMTEALERWSRDLVGKILPEILQIADMLDRYSKKEWNDRNISYEHIENMQIFDNYNYNMANLAIYISSHVNGVAKLHSEILIKDLFKIHYKYYPEKFLNVTNGVTPRRWMFLSNPKLSSLLDKKIGKEWRNDLSLLEKLSSVSRKTLIKDLVEIKDANKKKLVKYLKYHHNIEMNQNSIIYSQVKRIHEYKRQLMTILGVLYLYYEIKENKLNLQPTTFLFGGKSAPGYFRAKGIIKLINEVAKLINNDKDVNNILQVIFVANYNVSASENIVAGTDISLQVSTAGTEASGTGNMKFMQNGALTVGTLDGANVEINNLAGLGNNYIFGAHEQEVIDNRAYYNPNSIIETDPKIKRIVNTLIDGTFNDDNRGYFNDIYTYLTVSDYYFVLYDLKDFVSAVLNVNEDYRDQELFYNKVIENISNSGYFSSDRSIKEYAKLIWEL